jgi:hypothetical protein
MPPQRNVQQSYTESTLQLAIQATIEALLQPLAFQEARFETGALEPCQDAIVSPTQRS